MKHFYRLPLCFLLLLFSMASVSSEYVKYKNSKLSAAARVKDLLSRMTLEEKIGQMVQIDRTAATAQIMKHFSIGSVLSGGGSTPLPEASAEDWVNMVNDFQKGSLASRLGIPMIYGIDAVHGHNNVYNATIFPQNIGLGATRDPDLVKRIGAATALETRATGIPYVFAPCIAVCRDPRWGRCYESYSEDHKVVEAMTEIILGLQGDIPSDYRKGVPYVGGKDKVAACAKHFVGDGGTTNGINENNTVIDLHGLLSIHMPGYSDSIIKGVSTIMVSYSSWNGVKMHANHELVTGYLKNTLKFKGFVISDWEGIDRITSPPHANYTYSVLAGVQAGIDMAHRELAREAVRKSLVLLKNGKNESNPVLPLPKKASKILVAGSHADNLGYQCGGWTINWQGFSGNNLTRGITILSTIKASVHPSTEVVYRETPDSEFVKSDKFDYAIVAVGEAPYAETAGDSMNLTMLESGPDVIKNVCRAVKCVVIIISGRPIVIEPYVSSIDALVAAWLPGTEGQGVTDVLFGDFGFSGKLPRTWFKTVDQLPMNVGDPHYDPLYPFDFGLKTESVPSLVARSTSAGVDKRPYVVLIIVSLMIGSYFTAKKKFFGMSSWSKGFPSYFLQR
ncbi:lysosomal beta glucosidase-like isoform X3 [Mangifera indica]|uniref:lysosomal beta glucosidase-like isoform X3 n=1 Tax=Mangifera indica TaxID=29780 RepID=UPI001CF959A7|nr:lysosomal beta glucosidase-like isoform X3 [Mangifera indica]